MKICTNYIFSAKEIQKIRKVILNLSQEQLGEQLKLSFSAISRIEKGDRYLTADKSQLLYDLICKRLNVISFTPEELEMLLPADPNEFTFIVDNYFKCKK